MKKRAKRMLVLAIMTALLGAAGLLPQLIGAGNLEPTAPPGPTMKTLDEIPPLWHQILPASERFVDVMDGEAVLDKETGLVWAKDANLALTSGFDENGRFDWLGAIHYCNDLEIADRKGWRLPNIEELSSLVDMSQSESPKVPPGVFYNVQTFKYWSSVEYESDSSNAWTVSMTNGNVNPYIKSYGYYAWPVRGGSH